MIGYVILKFINTSLLYGDFPSDVKLSTITPIRKALNEKYVCDFRILGQG